MSLDHILLGMLEQPASGYDLGRQFEESARLFWFAELSQIYPTLRRLESKGFLVSREAASLRGPKRRVYERTPEGETELRAWLRQGPQIKTVRLSYIAQLYFLGELGDPEESEHFIEALRSELTAQLARFRAIEEMDGSASGTNDMSDAAFHQHAALRAGIHVARARLSWCEETLEALEQRRGESADADIQSNEAVRSA